MIHINKKLLPKNEFCLVDCLSFGVTNFLHEYSGLLVGAP
jgi:hypothetical protein